MPLYEYLCRCGKRFDQILPIAESDKKAKCPDCGKLAPRTPSRTGAPILKTGCGGFYKPSDQR